MEKNRVRQLLRAAGQRLTSAEILLRAQQHLDSMYLCGYGVECSLKALVVASTPSSKQEDVWQRISRGRRGHNLEWLKNELLRKQRRRMPPAVAEALLRVRTWSTDLRYETGLRDAGEAQFFFEAARIILQWAERSM